jgi:predicted metalloendopeptidase
VAAAIGRPGLPSNTPLAIFPTVDAKDPGRYALAVTQSGLGLPSRDFYLSDNRAFVAIRAKYRDYVEQMLALAKYPGAAESATAVAAVEARIAAAQWPIEKARNKDLTYNPKSLAELEAFAPGFPWRSALEGAGLTGRDRLVVKEQEAVRDLARTFGETPVATWRAYLTFHYLNAQADIMPAAFDDAQFAFSGKVLSGIGQKRERWKRAVGEISGPYGAGPLGEAVGRLYVAERFPPEAKAAILGLVKNLLAAYQKRITSLPWMSPETRAAAIRKAQTVRIKIGFPDRWKDYAALSIEPGDANGNRKRLSLFEWRRQLARLDSPTDKDEWAQGPQTVNAYYRADFNEIAFPAAILQPPLFDPAADAAVNYGGIGGVIGHEMGHGYDDQGAKSDERGILRNWWKPEDVERFSALTRALAAQYSSYSPIAGQHVNGEATSGENIGDLGGLSVALEAYQMSLGGRPAPVLDGTTGLQRFFLAWAQVWRGKYRDEYLRQLLTSDVHSPIKYRVNGVVRNIDAWYEAFGVEPGDALFLEPGKRVRIW